MDDARVAASVVLAALGLYHAVMVYRVVRREDYRRSRLQELVLEPDMLHSGMEDRMTILFVGYLLAFVLLWSTPSVAQTLSADYSVLRADTGLGDFALCVVAAVAFWVAIERRSNGLRRKGPHRRATDTI